MQTRSHDLNDEAVFPIYDTSSQMSIKSIYDFGVTTNKSHTALKELCGGFLPVKLQGIVIMCQTIRVVRQLTPTTTGQCYQNSIQLTQNTGVFRPNSFTPLLTTSYLSYPSGTVAVLSWTPARIFRFGLNIASRLIEIWRTSRAVYSVGAAVLDWR